jgi:hypothetical protein
MNELSSINDKHFSSQFNNSVKERGKYAITLFQTSHTSFIESLSTWLMREASDVFLWMEEFWENWKT